MVLPKGADDGKIYAYRNSTKKWEEFNELLSEKTWDEQYEEMIKNPEPYGGLEVIEKVGTSDLSKIFVASGSQFNFEYALKSIGSGSVDHSHVISAIDSGIIGGGDGANLHFLKAAVRVGGGDINVNQLTTLKQNIDADFDFDEIFDKHGFHKVSAAVYSGYTGKHVGDTGLNIDNVLDAINEGLTGNNKLSVEDAAKSAISLGKGFGFDDIVVNGVDSVHNAASNGYTRAHIAYYNLSDISILIVAGKVGDNLISVSNAADMKAKNISADAVAVAGVDQINDLLAAGHSADLINKVAASGGSQDKVIPVIR